MFNLRKFAFDKGLNQKDLGLIIGVAQSQISAMMSGKREIKEEHINKLRDRFGDNISIYIRNQPVSQGGEDVTPTKAELNNPKTMERFLDSLLRQNEELIRQNGALIDLYREERAKSKGDVAQKKEA